MKKIVVIGGGAAGFFSAIQLAELHPHWEICILEKSNKILSMQRVKIRTKFKNYYRNYLRVPKEYK